MDGKGIITIRLQRLHFSSNPCPRTFAMSCPHSQRVSPSGEQRLESDLAAIMAEAKGPK
jgi:hypothetical protein